MYLSVFIKKNTHTNSTPSWKKRDPSRFISFFAVSQVATPYSTVSQTFFFWNNEIGEKSLFPRTQKDCKFFWQSEVRLGWGREWDWDGGSSVDRSLRGRRVCFFFFPRLSQTDRQSATVKLMRGRMKRRRRKRGEQGDWGRGRVERKKEEGRQCAFVVSEWKQATLRPAPWNRKSKNFPNFLFFFNKETNHSVVY